MGAVAVRTRLLANRGLGATVGVARLRHRGWAKTTPVPTAASWPTVPYKVQKFMHWAPSHQ